MSPRQTDLLQFVFRQLSLRFQRDWLGATRLSPPSATTESALLPVLEAWEMPLDAKLRQRLRGLTSFAQLLERYMLKGVRLDSHMGLWGLVSDHYPVRLRADIPSPREMLDLQCEGERFVTYLEGPEYIDKAIGRFKGSFEFLMHDLEHAHKFFGNPELFRGQLHFFNRLRDVLPFFDDWSADALFQRDMDYLMSDMNSHPVHLFKYLKAIVLTAHLRREPEHLDRLHQLWEDVLSAWQTPDVVRASALKINQPGEESRADQEQIYGFFLGRFDSLVKA